MSNSFSLSQIQSLQAVETICSLLSVVGCLTMGYKIWMDRKSKSFIDYLLAALLFIDLILSLNYGVGIAGTLNPSYCQFQVTMNMIRIVLLSRFFLPSFLFFSLIPNSFLQLSNSFSVFSSKFCFWLNPTHHVLLLFLLLKNISIIVRDALLD